MNALEDIAEAREALSAGHNHDAARVIRRAMLETLDPVLLDEIHELADKGKEGAGRLRKRLVWEDILNQIEIRQRKPQG